MSHAFQKPLSLSTTYGPLAVPYRSWLALRRYPGPAPATGTARAQRFQSPHRPQLKTHQIKRKKNNMAHENHNRNQIKDNRLKKRRGNKGK